MIGSKTSRWKAFVRGMAAVTLVVSGSTLMTAAPVYAEGYIAGFAGWSLPQKFDNVNTTQPNQPVPGFPAGSSVSELSLTQSLMYGLKAGYYLNSLRFLGVEGEVYTNTPNFRQQGVQINGVGAGPIQGQDVRVITYGANVMLRVPGERLQPYVGIGPALFQAIQTFNNQDNKSSTRLGLNAEVGMRWLVTKHFMLFGEYKYNYARFHFESLAGDYRSNNLIAGIGWNF